MFADEPTGNLDSTTSGEILALLRDSVDALGQTTVMVTHDAHAAAIADRVLFLADGDIVRDLGPSQRARDPRDARGGERPMIGVALKGLAGRKVRALLTALAVVIGVVDGQRHVHPHRHDAEGVRRPLQRLATTRPTPSSAARRSSRTPPAAAASRSPSRCSTKVRALPEVEAAGGTVAPDEVNGADIIGRRRQGRRRRRASASSYRRRATRASARSSSRPATGPQGPTRS